MNKLIMRTASYTLTIIIALSLIVISLVSFINPIKMSDITYKLNMKSISVSFTEQGYQRSKDINDLALLVERAGAFNNYNIVKKYSKQFIEDKNFNSFCEFKDKNANGDVLGSYKNYIFGLYTVALYEKTSFQEAFAVAKFTISNNFDTDNYAINNANQILVMKLIQKNDKTNMKIMLDYLVETVYPTINEGYEQVKTDENIKAQLINVVLDIISINEKIGSAQDVENWRGILKKIK